MAILGQILARLGHFWALPKIFRNVSDHHRFQHKKYCGFGKFELLRRQSRHFFKIHYTSWKLGVLSAELIHEFRTTGTTWLNLGLLGW